MITPILYLAILMDHAHLVSPVAVAWSNPEFRKYMLRRPEKFILLPALLMVCSILFGLEVPRGAPAFQCMVGVYLLWNSYHFGMQNFGLMVLRGQRLIGFVLLCVTVLAMSVLPLSRWGSVLPILIFMEVISWSHWITDIGLSTFVSRYRLAFIVGVFALAPLGFLVKHVDVDKIVLAASPLIISVRAFGFGFIHFLYSRWIWKFSDPQVRATIGKTLFA